MKEAINILRKALGGNLDPNNPDHWEHLEDHKEHQLLNQPEHKEKGWVSNHHGKWAPTKDFRLVGSDRSYVPDPSSRIRGHNIYMAPPYLLKRSRGHTLESVATAYTDYAKKVRILEGKVKAVELKTGGYAHQRREEAAYGGGAVGYEKKFANEGRFHHVIHRNPDYDPARAEAAIPSFPWKTTHVDTHTGSVVGQATWRKLSDALDWRHKPFSSDPDTWFPAAHITKIHYHDDK